MRRPDSIAPLHQRLQAELTAAEQRGAPFEERERLATIIADVHGEPIEPHYMSREARLEELEGHEDEGTLGAYEIAELAYLRADATKTPRDFYEGPGGAILEEAAA